MNKIKICVIMAVFLLVNPGTETQGQSFTEVSRSLGIDYSALPDFLMGGGAVFFDYNNDNNLDLFFTGGNRRDLLYRNNGDGTFTETGIAAGILETEEYYTMGATSGDIDNDGDRDLLVVTAGRQQDQFARNLFYLNNGDGTFTEVGNSIGITHPSYSAAASFGDVNMDGYLDIYVANYVIAQGPIETDSEGNIISFNPQCHPNFLYLNNGDGTFSEVAAQLGLDNTFEGNGGCGLAVTFTDFDEDGYPDVYLANDFGEWASSNKLYRNRYPDAQFADVSLETRMNIQMFGMGIAIGDYDEDQDLDYYVTNIRGNVLLQNQGNGTFMDRAESLGVDNVFTGDKFTTGWGAVFFDYNNDSYLDLALANGFVGTEPIISTAVRDEDKLYQNNGDGTFTDVSSIEGFNNAEINRGIIFGDYDNDGDLDVFVSVVEDFESIDPHMLLYRNDTDNGFNWLKVDLQGTKSNRDGYGAHIHLYADNRVLMREIDGGSSFASQSSSTAHFGLANIESVDSLQITWPGGNKQIVRDIEVNQSIVITEEVVTSTDENSRLQFNFTAVPNPFSKDVTIKYQLPSSQKVLFQLMDVLGRPVYSTALNIQPAGNHEIELKNFQGQPGLYMGMLKVNDQVFTQRMLLLP